MTLIAAVDLSPPSINAARSAALLARMLHDRLLLVRAIAPVSAFYPELVLAGAPDLESAVRQGSEEALANIRLLLTDLAPAIEIDTRIVAGQPHEVIAECARAENARFIVIGTPKRGAASRLLTGGVAERTMREAPCPVLVLREDAAPFADWAQGERPLKIVAGVDRSAPSEAAVAVVAQLRKAGPCDVTLVHEYWPPAEYARLGLRGPRDLGRDDEEVVAILNRELADVWAALPAQPGGKVTRRVRAGWQAPGIELALDADAAAADLLVMGTGQPHGLARLRSGSDAISALHNCHVPLLAVPAPRRRAADHSAPIPLIRSVLVATDLSDFGNTAVPHAYALARRAGTRVELCHVVEHALPSPAYVLPAEPSLLTPAQRKAFEHQLEDLIPHEAAELGITSHVTIIEGGAASAQILQAAHRLGVDAIVIASHGRGGIGRAFFGSIAETIVSKSDLPVYVVRPPGH